MVKRRETTSISLAKFVACVSPCLRRFARSRHVRPIRDVRSESVIVVYVLLSGRRMGARARGDLSPRIAVPREERKFPRCDYISEVSMHVCIYMVGAFLRGGYVTVPWCWPRKVSPLLFSPSYREPLSSSISALPSPSVRQSTFFPLYGAFFTACWSPHSDLFPPLPSPFRTSPLVLSLKSSLFSPNHPSSPRAFFLLRSSFIRISTHSLQASSRLQAFLTLSRTPVVSS